jgi:hypothetical protein
VPFSHLSSLDDDDDDDDDDVGAAVGALVFAAAFLARAAAAAADAAGVPDLPFFSFFGWPFAVVGVVDVPTTFAFDPLFDSFVSLLPVVSVTDDVGVDDDIDVGVVLLSLLACLLVVFFPFPFVVVAETLLTTPLAALISLDGLLVDVSFFFDDLLAITAQSFVG